MLANRIRQYIRIIYYDQVGFTSEIQSSFILKVNKFNLKMIRSFNPKTCIWQNSISICDKEEQKSKNRGKLPQLDF